MNFSLILLLICVAASQDASVNTSETQQINTSTVQPPGTTDPGETLQTTTQLIIIQETTQMDVTNNTETTTSQSTWLPQTTELKIIATVDSSETFPAEANSTAYITDLGDRGGQDVETNSGLVAVLCIFCIVVAVVVVVVIVKAARSRRPQFERLDDVPMGKVNEDAPFARYPPK